MHGSAAERILNSLSRSSWSWDSRVLNLRREFLIRSSASELDPGIEQGKDETETHKQ